MKLNHFETSQIDVYIDDVTNTAYRRIQKSNYHYWQYYENWYAKWMMVDAEMRDVLEEAKLELEWCN